MRLALCNEVLRDMKFERQCELAASLGFDGLELAPFTLGAEPHRLPRHQRRKLRKAASVAGLEIVGLHWLLAAPPGLSITASDPSIRRKTLDVLRGVIGLCEDLGGGVLVHGSPRQRQILPGEDPGEALKRARQTFEDVVPDVEAAGVVYCIEALPAQETRLINTIEESAHLADSLGSPFFRTMIDCRAAALSETLPVADLIDLWLPTGKVAHIHLNDRNKRGPGQGEERFRPILEALRRQGYQGAASVEPFIYLPDGPTTAAQSIGYLRGLLESLP